MRLSVVLRVVKSLWWVLRVQLPLDLREAYRAALAEPPQDLSSAEMDRLFLNVTVGHVTWVDGRDVEVKTPWPT